MIFVDEIRFLFVKAVVKILADVLDLEMRDDGLITNGMRKTYDEVNQSVQSNPRASEIYLTLRSWASLLRGSVKTMRPSTDSGADSHLILDEFDAPGIAIIGAMAAKSTTSQPISKQCSSLGDPWHFHFV